MGISLPSWVDTVMSPLVGITLVLFGGWLIVSIFRHGKSFRMRSRWMIIIAGINKFFYFVHSKIAHWHKIPHFHYPDQYGLKTAFTIGMVHGIGAETPTQVFLFVTAAGVSKSIIGSLLLLLFVAGLLTSNTLITVVSAFGYAKMSEKSIWRLVIGVLTAVLSIIVGTLFLFHKTDILPIIIGG